MLTEKEYQARLRSAEALLEPTGRWTTPSWVLSIVCYLVAGLFALRAALDWVSKKTDPLTLWIVALALIWLLVGIVWSLVYQRVVDKMVLRQALERAKAAENGQKVEKDGVLCYFNK